MMASAVGDMPAVPAFDYRAVGEAIESRRQELNLTPSGLIRSINWLSAAPLARLRQGGSNTCQHVNGLLRWLGRSPESFSPGMVDGPECRIPDFGPYAVRWNMATLWEAVDAQRIDRGQSWDEVREATRYAEVEGIRLVTYGIGMHHAMNVVRWLGQPAATFMFPAERSPARPGSAAYRGPERAEAERSAPSLNQIYLQGTRGKTDQEIVDFARSRGGFADDLPEAHAGDSCHRARRGLRNRDGPGRRCALDLSKLEWQEFLSVPGEEVGKVGAPCLTG